MKVFVNGTARNFEEPANLFQLLEELGLKADRCAVELNRQLVARANWDSTSVKDGDELEIVQFVGGG